MAIVINQGAGVFSVTLTVREQRVLLRKSEDTNTTLAAVLDRIVTGTLNQMRQQFEDSDGDRLQEKYEAAPANIKAQVDALLP